MLLWEILALSANHSEEDVPSKHRNYVFDLGQCLLHYDWPKVPKSPMTAFAFPLDNI